MADCISRRAFTLVELLVVIGIIGILVIVLLPAIQSAREAGRRTQCINNLKQIGIAAQLHHDALQYYPSGGWEWWTPPEFEGAGARVGINQPAGWAFQLLPFLEARDDWQGGPDKSTEARTLHAIGAIQAVYFCPTRRAPQTLEYEDPYYLGGKKIVHALCDYAASNLEGTGLVRQKQIVRNRQVVDGLSKTLFAGDKRLNAQELGKWQEDDNEGYTAGWDEDTMRSSSAAPKPDHRGAGDGEELFGSSHPGGIQIVLADGSVHRVTFEVDPQVFESLGGISDGGSIDGLDLQP